MHEVSLVAELVDACQQASPGSSPRVVRVRHASSIPAETVRQAFELLTAGTALGQASLELDSFDVELRCPCGYVTAVAHEHDADPFIVCPSCDALVSRPRTPELELVAVVS
jgi:Zn finger protein HypA/HybF involved in hydrogenase expression